jgi:hypothetical protein
MAKSRKKAAAPEPPPPMPLIGDKVTMPRSKSVLEVNHVSRDGDEVDLLLPGTNLQWFRVRTDTLTFRSKTPGIVRPAQLTTGSALRLRRHLGLVEAARRFPAVPESMLSPSPRHGASWASRMERMEALIHEREPSVPARSRPWHRPRNS